MGALLGVGADQLWYDDTGGDADPLVLLHPGITDSTIWDRLIPLLDGHRVVRFDRRGFGQSPRATEPWTALGDLVAVLDHLGVGRAHLVGNSMGGETALALAVTAPQRVASMTLLCPGVSGYDWIEVQDDPELEALWIRSKENHDIAGLATVQSRQWFASGTDAYLEDQILRATELDLAPGCEFEQENPEQWSRLADVRIPTTVIAAERDPADSLQASIDIAGRIPGAELTRLDVDHVPQYRDPAAVAQAVLATAAR